MTSAIPVQRSTNWANKPIRSWSLCWFQITAKITSTFISSTKNKMAHFPQLTSNFKYFGRHNINPKLSFQLIRSANIIFFNVFQSHKFISHIKQLISLSNYHEVFIAHFNLAVENRSGYDEINAETISWNNIHSEIMLAESSQQKEYSCSSSVHVESHCSFSLRIINSVPFKREELKDGK